MSESIVFNGHKVERKGDEFYCDDKKVTLRGLSLALSLKYDTMRYRKINGRSLADMLVAPGELEPEARTDAKAPPPKGLSNDADRDRARMLRMKLI